MPEQLLIVTQSWSQGCPTARCPATRRQRGLRKTQPRCLRSGPATHPPSHGHFRLRGVAWPMPCRKSRWTASDPHRPEPAARHLGPWHLRWLSRPAQNLPVPRCAKPRPEPRAPRLAYWSELPKPERHSARGAIISACGAAGKMDQKRPIAQRTGYRIGVSINCARSRSSCRRAQSAAHQQRCRQQSGFRHRCHQVTPKSR